MHAPKPILDVWRTFDSFPMETLTKVWFYHHQSGAVKQREVALMKEHHDKYGIAGNCFDLGIWLIHELTQKGIEAYPVGHDLGTPDAHVAVIAKSEAGHRYYCDLGDQWLNPILIDPQSEDFTEDRMKGFISAAEVQVRTEGDRLYIQYHRPNGKVSRQAFDLTPIARADFWRAADISQNTLKKKPLLECRTPYKDEIAHWEFYNWESMLSTSEGLIHDPVTRSIGEWVDRIHHKTGYAPELLAQVLEWYDKMK